MSLSLTKRGQGPRPVATASDSLATKMVVSALGGMGAATFCHPIDVLRIQMQLYQFKGTADALKQVGSASSSLFS